MISKSQIQKQRQKTESQSSTSSEIAEPLPARPKPRPLLRIIAYLCAILFLQYFQFIVETKWFGVLLECNLCFFLLLEIRREGNYKGQLLSQWLILNLVRFGYISLFNLCAPAPYITITDKLVVLNLVFISFFWFERQKPQLINNFNQSVAFDVCRLFNKFINSRLIYGAHIHYGLDHFETGLLYLVTPCFNFALHTVAKWSILSAEQHQRMIRNCKRSLLLAFIQFIMFMFLALYHGHQNQKIMVYQLSVLSCGISKFAQLNLN